MEALQLLTIIKKHLDEIPEIDMTSATITVDDNLHKL